MRLLKLRVGLVWLCVPVLTILIGRQTARATFSEQFAKMLVVQPGATCLERGQLVAEVQRWLQSSTSLPDRRFVVRGSSTDPLRASLWVMQDGSVIARRDFGPEPADCAYLHAAIGLAIVLTLDAALTPQQPSTPSATGAETPDPASSPVSVPAVAARTASPTIRSTTATPSATRKALRAVPRRWSLALEGIGADRILPGVSPGAELALRYMVTEHFTLRLGGLGVLALNDPLGTQVASYHALLTGGRLDACGRLALAAIMHTGLCLGAMGGGLHASGIASALHQPATANVGWLAWSSRIELELRVHTQVSLNLALTVTYMALRVQLGVKDSLGEVRSTEPLGRPGLLLGFGPAFFF